jgi:hypothetical protein
VNTTHIVRTEAQLVAESNLEDSERYVLRVVCLQTAFGLREIAESVRLKNCPEHPAEERGVSVRCAARGKGI